MAAKKNQQFDPVEVLHAIEEKFEMSTGEQERLMQRPSVPDQLWNVTVAWQDEVFFFQRKMRSQLRSFLSSSRGIKTKTPLAVQ